MLYMKNLVSSKIIFLIISLIFLFSCVSMRKFDREKANRIKCEKEYADLSLINKQNENTIRELQDNINEINKKISQLKKDTATLIASSKRIQKQYDKINDLNNQLIDKFEKQKTGNYEDTKKILTELQAAKEDLFKREESLKKLETDLQNKENKLNDLNNQLTLMQSNMKEKQKKLEELQSILNKKDSIVKALKAKVIDALLGFENNGLTIYQKNGKIYVSMEENLLFPSGSFAVNTRGVEALKKLAKLLETNADVNILVEGHTDNVTYKGAGQLKDNWDLSVMRATAIAKIIIANAKIDPKRITAAGRSEYAPVESNSTSEGKAKNRRTEIILTPKLDELFKIIESN